MFGHTLSGSGELAEVSGSVYQPRPYGQRGIRCADEEAAGEAEREERFIVFEKIRKHPSFGMIGLSHVQSTGTVLVGSEFKHQNFITLTIQRAEHQRDLSREWWFGKERLIEIHMSEAQFVEFIAR